MNSEILVKFKGDTSDLDKSTEKADSSISELASKLGGKLATGAAVATAAMAATAAAAVAVGKAMWKGANETAAYGDEIDKTSQKVGLSTDAYQKWDYVMKLSGTSMKESTVGLKTMTNKVDDAINGSKTATKQFEALGISVDDLKGKTREEIFGKVVESLQNVEDETKKAALANDMFGKSGQNLIPLLNQSADSTQQLMDEAEQYGMVMSNDAVKASAAFEDSLTKLQGTMGGLKNRMMAELLPGLTEIMGGFSDLIAGVDGADERIYAGIENIANVIATIIPKVVEGITKALPTIISAGLQIIKALIDGILAALPQIIPEMVNIVLTIVKGIIEYLPQLLEAAIQIIVELAKGLIEALPTLIPSIVEVVITIVNTLIDNIDLLIDAAIDLIIALAEGIIDALPILISKAPEIIIKLVKAIIRNIPKLLEAAVEIIKMIVKGLGDGLGKIVDWAKKLPGKIKDGIISALGKIGDVGMNLVKGIWNGINNATQWIIDKIKGFGKKVMDGIKKIFGIHSPSVVMKEQIGVNLGLGVIEGIDATQKEINKEVGNMYDNITGVMNPIIKSGTFDTSVSSTLTDNASQHYSPTINVVVNNDMEIDPLGQVVSTIKTFSGGAKNDYNYGVGR